MEVKRLQVGHEGKADGGVARNEERENGRLGRSKPRTTRLSCEVQLIQSSLREV